MQAAQCGNVPLVEALLERGADPLLRDHYGHSAWDYALARVLDDPAHTPHHLDALFTLLAPPALDAQVQRNLSGFCAEYLMRQVERVPHSVLPHKRHTRTYFNSVLARAEVHSSYQPSRQLWLRTRVGYYTFNPELQLRAHSSAAWTPWKAWLNQPLVFAGCAISEQATKEHF